MKVLHRPFESSAANVADALSRSSSPRRSLMRFNGFSQWQYLCHAGIYETLSALLLTARTVVPFALALEIALGYFVGMRSGLGRLISEAWYYPGREPQAFAAIVASALLGICAVKAINALEDRVNLWRRDT